MTRSASIVEEMESRPLPNPRVDRDFRAGKWPLLDQSYRDFAINCATRYTSDYAGKTRASEFVNRYLSFSRSTSGYGIPPYFKYAWL